MGFLQSILKQSPFRGTMPAGRVPLFARGRPSLPFPHPWNYHQPIRILDSFFWRADEVSGPARHTRYLDVPGFDPILVTRDPRLIRAISTITSDQPGHFDRDTLPSSGIARATGQDTLLYSNGASWKHQKKIATPPFARTTLFQPERFHDFESLFRHTVAQRLEVMQRRLQEQSSSAAPPNTAALDVELEPEIKALMLEMLVNCFFGAQISYDEIYDRYVPALDRVIAHIVRDTVLTNVGVPLHRLPAFTSGLKKDQQAKLIFEELTDRVIAQRSACTGLWGHFKSDASDDALRGNIRVFLAGALEATTSYASWAIAHLARHPHIQSRLYAEIHSINEYSPEVLARCTVLNSVLDETLRLTPSLYFHPRRATAETQIDLGPLPGTTEPQTFIIPKGTHILLDVWHANRHEDHWGVTKTGYRADEFHPERSEKLATQDRGDVLHFGFGHGPRFCPGKNLGQLEVALVVGACVKLFEFESLTNSIVPRAGVSTKPLDGVRVNLRPRVMNAAPIQTASEPGNSVSAASSPATRCPFGFGGKSQ